MKKLKQFLLVITVLLSSNLAPTLVFADNRGSYTLDSGDKLKVTVFNQKEFDGEYTVDGDGNISLPLIGTVAVKNQSLQDIETLLKNKLSPDYLVNPKIALEVLNYRPFYILGEVSKPDSYPYVSGMTYRNAIVIGGGFTYRAKEDVVFVIHEDDPEQKEIIMPLDAPVLPGDIIRIDERLF